MTSTPRARVRLLARSGRARPGIFAPLVLAQAAEIEALPLREFLCDPTKLTKGLTSLHGALRTDAVVTAGADGLLAEAAGAELDWETYPPAVVAPGAGAAAGTGAAGGDIAERAARHPRVEAAVEATSRLAATVPGDPALVAALTGPATLATELGGDPADEPFMETIGRVTLEVLKRFLEGGVNVVVLVEATAVPAGGGAGDTSAVAVAAWRSVITPLVNVTRFHQAAPVLVFESPPARGDGVLDAVPPSIGLCVPDGLAVPGPPARLRGVALPREPKEWPAVPPEAPLAVTAGVVPGHCTFAEVLDACGRVNEMRGSPDG